MLALTVLRKRFQPIPRRYCQVLQNMGCVQLVELAACHPFKADEPSYPFAFTQSSSVPAFEQLDRHRLYTISKCDIEARDRVMSTLRDLLSWRLQVYELPLVVLGMQ